MTHHEFLIIDTAIPKHLMSDIEVDALGAFGLIMFDDGYYYTISSGDHTEAFPVLEVDDTPQMLAAIAHDYRNEAKPEWVANIEYSLGYLHDLQIDTTAKFPLTAYKVTVLSILEGCIQKRANAGFGQIKEVLVESSYIADDASVASKGGWAAMVSPAGIEFASTPTMIEQFRDRKRSQVLRDQDPFISDLLSSYYSTTEQSATEQLAEA